VSLGPIGGIFVGGAGTRMGGRAKGLLATRDGATIVDRWRAILTAAGVETIVLVGAHDAYAHLGLETIHDAPAGIGPLGGLVALLRRAGEKTAIAVACDMPSVSTALMARLLQAPDAPVVAPRRNGRWEPLFARYDARAVRPLAEAQAAAQDHSLQRLLERAGAVELPISAAEADELHDWDTPEDAGAA
jgi:molybdopterin-guanine dinucleotide biosynthesis protein A